MKKYKVKITKEKVIIKPLPGHEIDQDLICVLNRHYEHNGVFKPIKKELPKTWEEYCDTNKTPQWLEDWASIPGKYKALGKLEILRDHYNDGWVPDWENDSSKFIIFKEFVHIVTACITIESAVLAFKSEKLRDEFLTNFRELIKNAKPLL